MKNKFVKNDELWNDIKKRKKIENSGMLLLMENIICRHKH